MPDIVVSNIKPRGTAGGAQIISTTLNWDADTNFIFDFGFLATGTIFKSPKTLFVDNSENPSEITVYVENTGQSFPIPGYQIGYYPLALADGARVVLSSAGGTGADVNVQFYNYVVAPFTWAGPSAPASANIAVGNDASGALPTAAPVFVAGIDTVGGQVKPFLIDDATGELLVKTTVPGVATEATLAIVSGNIADIETVVSKEATLATRASETTLAAIAADLSEGTTPARTTVAGNVASVQLIASNTSRKGLTIYNDSTATLYIGYGATAVSATDYSVKLDSGDYFEVPDKFRTLEIRGIWTAANGFARITSLT